MKEFVKSLLSSKKVLATLAAILVWALGRFGMDVAEDQLLPVVGSLAAFVLAQGWADQGKEAVKEADKRGMMAPPSGPVDPS